MIISLVIQIFVSSAWFEGNEILLTLMSWTLSYPHWSSLIWCLYVVDTAITISSERCRSWVDKIVPQAQVARGELTRPGNRNILMGRMEKYFCDTGLNMNVHQSTDTASRHCYKGEGETGIFLWCQEVWICFKILFCLILHLSWWSWRVSCIGDITAECKSCQQWLCSQKLTINDALAQNKLCQPNQ